MAPPQLSSFGPPEIQPKEVSYDPDRDLLGEGSFGSVYAGRCRGLEVAIKTPLKQNLSDVELESFRHEVQMMRQIYHPNVVMLMGACTERGKLQIITERCKTDLETLLASSLPLSLYERLRMARDAALGMDWLHSVTKLVHRDLKTANLLVDYNNRVKVADFGFAQLKTECSVKDTPRGSLLWMAPEIMQRQTYDERVDVYSFGIILWEIISRKKPFTHYKEPLIFCQAIIYAKERPPLPDDIPEALKYLMQLCWRANPKERISFDEVVYRLGEIMVECVIDYKTAADFWKKYFLEPNDNLQEKVTWAEFKESLNQEVKLDGEDTIYLHQLLVSQEPELKEEIVTMERFVKIVKCFGPFYEAINGHNYLKEMKNLMSQSWFHGDISSLVANSRLAREGEGAFLIRISASGDPKKTPFTLSVTGDGHFRMERVVGGGFLVQTKVYGSIFELVATNKDLKRPCPKNDESVYQ